MVEKPEGLEKLRVTPHAVHQVVPGGGQHIGQPIGFPSPIEELPVWCRSGLIRLRQVQDVGLVVQDQVRAPGVVAIYLVDTVPCKEGGLTREGKDKGNSSGEAELAPGRPWVQPSFLYPNNFLPLISFLYPETSFIPTVCFHLAHQD